MKFTFSRPLSAILLSVTGAVAADPIPKLPLVLDSALKVEQLATVPEVEATTTVAAAPDGSFYVGCDPRDTRLNSANPECWIVRFSGTGPDRKRTVFADKLYSPAGSYWFRGSLYLVHDPFLTRFRDTNGDGVADEREDLVTGLGLPPYEGLNDHVVSGMTLGMDGFFYIAVGDRGVLNAKGKDGSTAQLHGGGILRVRPDGTQLEVYSTGTRNHLMVDLDAQDHPFTRDNTDDGNGWWTRVTHHIEGGYYGYPYDYHNPTEAWLPAMGEYGGGSPTGGLVYMSDGLPEKYRNQPLFSEWGKSTVFSTELDRDGATFRIKQDNPVVRSDGKLVDFRPMELAVANDGALLIADWSWGGWKAAKVLGNVWRLSWPEAKPAARVADDAPTEQLIAALSHVDRGQRLRAQWALAAKGEAVRPALAAVLADEKRPAVQRWHALWTLDQIGGPDSLKLIRERLADSDPTVRAQAARALGIRRIGIAAQEITRLLQDQDAEVRLQAVTALGRIYSKQGWQARSASTGLVALLKDNDRWIRFAARDALKKIADWSVVQKALHAGDTDLAEQAWLTLARVYDDGAVQILAEASHDKDAAFRERAVDLLSSVAYEPKPWDGHWWGTQPAKTPPPANSVVWSDTPIAGKVLISALADAEPNVRLAAAKGIARGTGLEPAPALRQRLAEESDAEVRRQIVETLGALKDSESGAAMVAIAADPQASEELRRTAITAIGNLGGTAAKTTIAELVGKEFAVPTTVEIIKAAGALKVTQAVPALSARSTHADPAVRTAAIKALGQIGNQPGVLKPLISALTDTDKKVQAEAVDAIGALKPREALPQLIALAEITKDEGFRRKVLTAICDIPDPKAIPVLVKFLFDPQSRLRREVARALVKFGDDAGPLLEAKLANVTPEMATQARALFNTGVVAKWRVIGPFENVWEAQHEVERDITARGAAAPDLAKHYVAADGKPAEWREVQGDPETGRVDLGKFFKTSGLAAAYAYLEINSPEAATAKLVCGSDDQIAVWLNGQKVLDRSTPSVLEAGRDEVPLQFVAGRNQVLAKLGNTGGAWEFAVRVPNLIAGKYVVPKEASPDEKQRIVALLTKPDGSWQTAGDPAKGERLFHDPTAALSGICATCHTARGKGGQIGPDLTAIGVNYKRPDLITSIHEPSKTIALGFEQVMVETNAGESFVGAMRNETADGFSVVGADGQPHVVRKADIKSKQSLPTSLMPPGLTLGLKPDEFVDLLAYLESLRGK